MNKSRRQILGGLITGAMSCFGVKVASANIMSVKSPLDNFTGVGYRVEPGPTQSKLTIGDMAPTLVTVKVDDYRAVSYPRKSGKPCAVFFVNATPPNIFRLLDLIKEINRAHWNSKFFDNHVIATKPGMGDRVGIDDPTSWNANTTIAKYGGKYSSSATYDQVELPAKGSTISTWTVNPNAWLTIFILRGDGTILYRADNPEDTVSPALTEALSRATVALNGTFGKWEKNKLSKRTCQNCDNGQTSSKCSKCDGSSLRKCPVCKEGYVVTSSGKVVRCDLCNGSELILCKFCSGGKVFSECKYCKDQPEYIWRPE